MQEMNVNILDYISDEKIQTIAEEEFRNAIRRHLYEKGALERMLTNVSYEIVFKAVAEVVKKSEEEIEKLLAERVIQCLDADTVRYEMFRTADSYFDEGPANPILRKIVAESEGLMRETVEKNIREYNFSSVRHSILDMVYEVIEKKLFSEKDEKRIEEASECLS